MKKKELNEIIIKQQKEIENLQTSLRAGENVIEKLKTLAFSKSQLEGQEVWEHAGVAFDVVNQLQQICLQGKDNDAEQRDSYELLYNHLKTIREYLLAGNSGLAYRLIKVAVEKGKGMVAMVKEGLGIDLVRRLMY